MNKIDIELIINILDRAIYLIRNKEYFYMCTAIESATFKACICLKNIHAYKANKLETIIHKDLKFYYNTDNSFFAAKYIIINGFYYNLFKTENNKLSRTNNFHNLKAWALTELRNKYIEKLKQY